MISYGGTDKTLESLWAGRRLSRALVISAFACVSILGCRQDSTETPPDLPPDPSVKQSESHPSPKTPSTSFERATPSDERQGSAEPTAAKVTVTLLSNLPNEAERDGTATDEFNSPVQVANPKVFSIPDKQNQDVKPAIKEGRAKFAAQMTERILRDIELDLLAKWDAIHSLSSTIKTSFNQKTKGRKIKTSGMGTRDALKTGGTTLIRSLFGTNITIEITTEDPPIRATRQEVLKVFDGVFLYTQLSTHEGTTATRKRATPDSIIAMGGPGLFAVLRKVVKLRRLPNVKINNRTMYVFNGSSAPGVQIEYTIDKETGLLHRVKRTWKLKDQTQELSVTKHEINIGFPEDHFSFTPADGVEIQDLTQGAATPPQTTPQP